MPPSTCCTASSIRAFAMSEPTRARGSRRWRRARRHVTFAIGLAISVSFLPVFARLTPASVLELRDREFVLAARALGARDATLVGRHIFPNTMPPLIVQATISFPVAILAEAALSYLGLGTQPPHPSWGLMLREAQAFLSMSPWFAIFPGTAIALTVLGLNLLGDGLRDLLDPKLAG